MFHSLVNLKWRWFLLLLIAAYFLQYLIFGVFYYFEYECIKDADSFWDALCFSVQTQSTIGYGSMAPLTETEATGRRCYRLNVIIMFQIIVSLIVDFAVLGIMYEKIANPSRRAHSIGFSQNCTLYSLGNGVKCLSYRVANLRHHQLIDPEVRLMALMKTGDKGGGPAEPLSCFTLKLKELYRDEGDWRWPVFLGVPSEVTHFIDETSPLFGLDHQGFQEARLELLAILTATDASTSNTIEARASYFPADILYDKCFAPCLVAEPGRCATVKFDSFNVVVPAEPASIAFKHTLLRAPSGGARSGSGGDAAAELRRLRAKAAALEEQVGILVDAIEADGAASAQLRACAQLARLAQ